MRISNASFLARSITPVNQRGVRTPINASAKALAESATTTPIAAPTIKSGATASQQPLAPDSTAAVQRQPHRGRTPDTLMEKFKAAFGSSEGDANYDAAMDFDHDGEVAPNDFTFVTKIYDLARPKASFEQLQKAFGSVKGDDQYDASVDLNHDGEVGPQDFAILHQGMREGNSVFDRFQESFGSMKGDANFNQSADIDGDGEVGANDFAALSAALRYKL